jgi:hypothetical protein
MPPINTAVNEGRIYVSCYFANLWSALLSGSDAFRTATEANTLLPGVSHLAQCTVYCESCHLSDDLITFHLTQIPPTNTSPAHTPPHINQASDCPVHHFLSPYLTEIPPNDQHITFTSYNPGLPNSFTQCYMPKKAYLLCSLQQRQMDV